MRKYLLLFVMSTLLGMTSAWAQFQVKGRVISADDKEPLTGVSVVEKGTGNGVITDIDGNYTATIQLSYVGMKSVEKTFTAAAQWDVTMISDSELMDEVVVVAYGVRKKGTTTGSMAVVNNAKIENVPAPSFDQALQGQSSGLQVLSNSGEPGAVATFKIRGVNSINAGTEPLFILDGVAI